MDQRVEAFLADVLALEGETSDAIRQAVRAGLADCEAVFRTQESNRRMKDRGRTHAIRYAALAWPRNAATEGNTDGGALTTGPQYHRRAAIPFEKLVVSVGTLVSNGLTRKMHML